MHSNGRQHTGQPEDENQVVDDDHHDIDRNLWSDRRVGLKVEGAIEHIAERESACVSNSDGERHGEAEPTAQTREYRQIQELLRNEVQQARGSTEQFVSMLRTLRAQQRQRDEQIKAERERRKQAEAAAKSKDKDDSNR